MGISARAFIVVSAIVVFDWITLASMRAQPPNNSLPVEIVPTVGHSGYVWSVKFSPDGRSVLSGGDTVKLWNTTSGRLIRTFEGHREVFSVAFSPDGRSVLSGGDAVKLSDTASGRLIRTFEGHRGIVYSVAFSPDGRLVLSGSEDKTLKLWDVATGKLVRTFEGHGDRVYSVAFSPDGHSLLSGSLDGTLRIWGVATGKLIRVVEGSEPVAFSVDGRSVLSGGEVGLKLWDVATGKLIRAVEGNGPAAFSADGRSVLSGGEVGLKLWDIATGRLIRSISVDSDVQTVALSPDGRRALTGGNDNTPKLWDVATGNLIHALKGIGEIRSVAFSPDGHSVLSGSLEDGTLRLWDRVAGRLIRIFDGHPGSAKVVAFSPDGHSVVSGSAGDDKSLKLWDAAKGELIRSFDEQGDERENLRNLVFSSDGRKVLSGAINTTPKLWDVATGKLIRAFDGLNDIGSVAFLPDGLSVLAVSGDHTLKLWGTAKGQVTRYFEAHGGKVACVAISPDGRRVLTCSTDKKYWDTDKTLKYWDINSGRLIETFEGHGKSALAIAISPDGRSALSGGGDGAVKLWDVASGRLIRTFGRHSSWVGSVAFSPNGRSILSAGISDGELKLWDVASGHLIRSFEETEDIQTDIINSAAFSPDGALIGVASGGTIKILRTESGELLASFIAMGGGEWVTITPEGFFDASANGAQALSVVRGLEVYSVDQVYQALYRPDLVREKLAGDPQAKVREAAAKLDLAKVIASGGAPRVEITALKSGASVADEQVNVEAAIADQGGGIGKVEWRVNGVTLGVETRGLGPEAGTAKSIPVRRRLTLEPGDNRIEIVAYNAKGFIASEPARITVKWTGEKASTPPRLRVLAVGVNDYWDSRLKLNFAAPDAKAMGEALRQAGASLYERVDVTTVLDADATDANLDRVFGDLAKQVRPRDVFVFFLAGHGRTVDGRYYFIPQDFRYQGEESFAAKGVGQDRWQEWFARIPARKSVLLYDTCESGSLTGEHVASRGIERVTALEKMTRAVGRTVLAASTDDAPALEGYRGHGVFTYVALEALGQAHAGADGLIQVTDLAAYIDEKVPEVSNAVFKMRQVPQMNIVGSNFPLVRKTAVLPAAQADVSAPSIPGKPTHVVITAAKVRQSAKPDAPIIVELIRFPAD